MGEFLDLSFLFEFVVLESLIFVMFDALGAGLGNGFSFRGSGFGGFRFFVFEGFILLSHGGVHSWHC